jgi:serine/threonine protein kinase HipA of HipAB toxin-antitoxin module
MCEPVTLAALATAATSAGAVGAGATVAGVAGATATTAGLTAMQALALGASVGGTVLSASSAYQQGQVAKQVGRNNATMAEYAAQDAQKRGEEDHPPCG